MNRKTQILFLFLIQLFSLYSCKETAPNKALTIAAASNLRPVLEEIKVQFEKENNKVSLNISYGASGTLTQQIVNGADFDLFMSADTQFPKIIEKEGLAGGAIVNYAYGKVVLWSSGTDLSQGLEVLLLPNVKKIAIANPKGAPYGEGAVALLKKENIYNKVKDKIVWGENIGQTAQFAYSGNAEVGFIALSQALTPEMKAKGEFIEFSEEVSPKIAQAAVLIKKENTHQAQLFLNYVLSPSCKELWTKHGYETNKVRKP